MDLGKGVGTVAMDGAAFLGGEHALGHARELLVRRVDKSRQDHWQRKAGGRKYGAGARHAHEGIVSDEGTTAGNQVLAEPFEERIEQAPSVETAGAPGRQPA